MRVTFLGTRGEIELRSRGHRLHSALLLETDTVRVMVDCGADWIERVWAVHPAAILLTHAHEDHAGGLRAGSPAPVYATEATWAAIGRYPIGERHVLEPRTPVSLGSMTVDAFPVEHSLRAPAVGLRVVAGSATLFYVPDVVAIGDQHAALTRLGLYVGDGAAVTRPIVRSRNGVRIGHASVRQQLDWCAGGGVCRAIFTHCGSEIVRGDGRTLAARVRALGRERGVEAAIARDGMWVELGTSDEA